MKLELMNIIKNNKNWEEILTNKPYCLKIKRYEGYILFKYDQINSDFSLNAVKEARGIIFREEDWKLVCFPFTKFFNVDEIYADKIDWDNCQVQEKIDGSLIKVWFDSGVWNISTNGNINAMESEIGNDLCPYDSFGDMFLNNFKYMENPSSVLNKNYTYMFEMVSPYTKIVVNYPKIDIYHIGTRDNLTGKELNVDIGIKKPKLFNLGTKQEVKEAAYKLPFNEEGYVVVDKDFNRVKIKSPAYVNAHRLVNNHVINKEKILDLIRINEQSEFLSYFPEYNKDFKDIENRFLLYKKTLKGIKDSVDNINMTSKEFALFCIREFKEDKDFGFKIFQGKIKSVQEYIDSLTSKKIIERIYKDGN